MLNWNGLTGDQQLWWWQRAGLFPELLMHNDGLLFGTKSWGKNQDGTILEGLTSFLLNLSKTESSIFRPLRNPVTRITMHAEVCQIIASYLIRSAIVIMITKIKIHHPLHKILRLPNMIIPYPGVIWGRGAKEICNIEKFEEMDKL